VGFTWTSGGGTTAAYQIAYQTGASAPANCSAGTVISANTLGVNPTSYTITGLTASTQYSFRLCAYNSDLSSASTGRTVTVTTKASGASPTVSYGSTQVVFQTSTNYTAGFGGLYFADYICQNEANNSGLSGVWKAILSDDSTAASSRISIAGNIYNNRPLSSNGIQWLANGAAFWNAIYSYPLNYTSTGGTTPNSYVWTGSTYAGAIKVGLTCSSWTTNSAAVNGEYAYTPSVGGTGIIDNGNTPCSNTILGFYCTNQQSAAAAPPNPTGFAQSGVSNNSVTLIWTSGGGTTAAYQIAYQTGASAPANCSTGNVISASTLGINPSTYQVTGLNSGTQYSFRLCAYNSDLSLASSGVTVTSTTTSLTTLANQTIFATGTNYYPTWGGLYFADFICQTEATNASLAGVWKAIMADGTTSASSRIALSATIWNNRPAGSGGQQQIGPKMV
jgi:hypothetical protein